MLANLLSARVFVPNTKEIYKAQIFSENAFYYQKIIITNLQLKYIVNDNLINVVAIRLNRN